MAEMAKPPMAMSCPTTMKTERQQRKVPRSASQPHSGIVRLMKEMRVVTAPMADCLVVLESGSKWLVVLTMFVSSGGSRMPVKSTLVRSSGTQ